MKVFTISSALLPLAACAFCPTEHRQSRTFAHDHSSTPSVILQSSRSSSDVQLSQEDQEDQEEQVSVPPSRPLEPQTEQKMSISIPFLACPKTLKESQLAGNVGFDPLGLAKNKELLWEYREAEIKHARLAMLVSSM